MKRHLPLAAGILAVLMIALAARALGSVLPAGLRLGSLTLGIVLGMIIGNTLGLPERLRPGVRFSLDRLLQAGIVLLGFGLDLEAIFALGPTLLLIVLCYVGAMLFLAIRLGRVFGLGDRLAVLIGVGSGVCGASAVMAVAPCIEADDDEAIIAVSLVNFLGALGVLIYSALATSSSWLEPTDYGIWSGLTLHGVAHAMAAAFALGEEAGGIATLVKMSRVMLLVPVMLILAHRFHGAAGGLRRGFPLYILLFLGATAIGGFDLLPEQVTALCGQASSLLILMASCAMGLSVRFRGVLRRGALALGLASLLFLLFSGAGLAAVLWLL